MNLTTSCFGPWSEARFFMDTFWRPDFCLWRLNKTFQSPPGAFSIKLISDRAGLKSRRRLYLFCLLLSSFGFTGNPSNCKSTTSFQSKNFCFYFQLTVFFTSTRKSLLLQQNISGSNEIIMSCQSWNNNTDWTAEESPQRKIKMKSLEPSKHTWQRTYRRLHH